MKISVISASVLFAVVVAGFSVQAQTVKTWVDEDGVTHYSDQKPADAGAEVKEVELPDANVTEFDTEETNTRIQKQLEQLERDRKAREAEAEAEERARALEEAMEREPMIVEEKKKKKKRRKKKRPVQPLP